MFPETDSVVRNAERTRKNPQNPDEEDGNGGEGVPVGKK